MSYPQHWVLQPDQWRSEVEAIRKRARALALSSTIANPDNLSDIGSDNDDLIGPPQFQTASPSSQGLTPDSPEPASRLLFPGLILSGSGPSQSSLITPDISPLKPAAKPDSQPQPYNMAETRHDAAYTAATSSGMAANPGSQDARSSGDQTYNPAPFDSTSQTTTPTRNTAQAPPTTPADWEAFLRGLMTAVNKPAPAPEPQSSAPATWRLADVGYFYPDADDAKFEAGPIFRDQRDTCYRDFHIWWRNVAATASGDLVKENVLRRELHSLLRGAALQWYHAQLDKTEQIGLRVDLAIWKRALEKRFGIKPEDASAWFHSQKSRFSKDDSILGRPIRTYAMDVARYARVWGDTSDFQILTRLYDGLHARLRQVMDRPTPTDTLGNYLDRLDDKARSVTDELKDEQLPARARRNAAAYYQEAASPQSDTSSDDADYANRGNRYRDRRPRQGDRPYRNDRRNDRRDGRHSPRWRETDRYSNPVRDGNQGKGSHRGGQFRRRRGQRWVRARPYRDGSGYHYSHEVIVWEDEPNVAQREHDLEHNGWIAVSDCSSDEECFSGDDNDQKVSNFFDTVSPDGTQQSAFFQHPQRPQALGASQIHRLSRQSMGQQGRNRGASLDQKEHTCRKCKAVFNNRRVLMDHVFSNSCVPPRRPHTGPHSRTRNRQTEPVDKLTDGQVVEATANPDAVSGEFKSTYLRIPLKFDVTGADLDICVDTGASSTLVSEMWLKQYGKKVRYESMNPRVVTGVKSTFTIDRKAIFDFYIPGTARGKAIHGHFTVTADLIPELGPNLLLGMDFLRAHGAKIDAEQGTVTFRSVFNMTVQGEVVKRPSTSPIHRQVTAHTALTIQPKEQALIPVDYVDLPKTDADKDTAYTFVPSTPGLVAATISSAGPKLLLAYNATDKPIAFGTGQKLGHITACETETANFVTWNDAAGMLDSTDGVISFDDFFAALQGAQVDEAPAEPVRTIALDFIVGLPEISSSGTMWALPGYPTLDCLCPVNCRFSKKTILLAGHSTYTAKDWAVILLRGFQLCNWGLPDEIVSDRDPKFTSDLWRAIHSILHVKLKLSTAYHPQTDGLSERKNQTVEIAIRFHTNTSDSPNWSAILPALQHNLNNSLSEVLGKSPNEVVLGFKPRTPIDMAGYKPDNVGHTAAIDTIRQIYQDKAIVLIDAASEIAKQRYDDSTLRSLMRLATRSTFDWARATTFPADLHANGHQDAPAPSRYWQRSVMLHTSWISLTTGRFTPLFLSRSYTARLKDQTLLNERRLNRHL